VNNDLDFLVASRAKIESFGWIQGGFGDPVQGYCTLGAVKAAVIEDMGYDYCAYRATYTRLAEQLPSLGWRLIDGGDNYSGSIAVFNDSPATSKQDVLALFDKAIAGVLA